MKKKKKNNIKNNIKKIMIILSVLLVIILLLILGGCHRRSNGLNKLIEVESITIRNKISELTYGQSYKFEIEFSPKNATNNDIIWTSSNTDLLSIDQDGTARVVSNEEGTVIITATSKKNNNIATGISILIKKVDTVTEMTDLILKSENINLSYGESFKIPVTIFPSTATNSKLIWESSDPSLVTVDSNGKVTAIANKDGNAVITVGTEDRRISSSIGVTVKKVDTITNVEKVGLNKSSITLYYNETATVTATVSPSNATNKNVTWTSSDPSLVTVDSNGKIRAVGNKDGSAIVTVKTIDGNKTDTINVTVKKVNIVVGVTGVNLSKNSITLNYGETEVVTATVSPANATNKNVTWTSSDPSLVTVDSNGNIKAKANKNGTATITVKTVDGNKKDTIKVTVKKVDEVISVTGVKVDKKEITLKYGEIEQITATVSPIDATNKNVTWTSSDASLVTVDSNGNIKAKANKNGTATITVKTVDGSKTATVKVKVEKVEVVIGVTGISISANTDNVLYLNNNNDKTLQLTATVSPASATNKEISWQSINPNVATVDSKGMVTAKSLGTTTITATTKDGNKTAAFNVIVKQKSIVVITASAGKRMANYFKNYTSKNGNYYVSEENLKYVYLSGSGFSYQTHSGLKDAKSYLASQYTGKEAFVDLSVFFTLTGNEIKNATCEQIKNGYFPYKQSGVVYENNTYTDQANRYNNAIQDIINFGYINTKGYVISHSPLNTVQAINEFPEKAESAKIVYSHKPTACLSGYRSAYKYWLSNQSMIKAISNNYSNLTFIDNFSNFVVKDSGEDVVTFTWKTNEKSISYRDLYKTTDGLHWDSSTTQMYMQKAFDTAGM